MKPYFSSEGITLYHGNAREILREMPESHVENVIADPPYGVEIAEWDRPLDQFDIDALLRVSGGKVILFSGARPDSIERMLTLRPRCDRVYIWRYTFTLLNTQGAFWQFQPFYVWGKETLMEMGRDVIECNHEKNGVRLHPTQKPLKLMRQIIGSTVGKVMDPFAGSGTTLLACKMAKREAIGIEEKYCEITAKRLSQMHLPFEE